MVNSTKLTLPGGLSLWHLILLGVMVIQYLQGNNARDNMATAFRTHTRDVEEAVEQEIKDLKAGQIRLSDNRISLEVLKSELVHVRADIADLTKKVDLLIGRR